MAGLLNNIPRRQTENTSPRTPTADEAMQAASKQAAMLIKALETALSASTSAPLSSKLALQEAITQTHHLLTRLNASDSTDLSAVA